MLSINNPNISKNIVLPKIWLKFPWIIEFVNKFQNWYLIESHEGYSLIVLKANTLKWSYPLLIELLIIQLIININQIKNKIKYVKYLFLNSLYNPEFSVLILLS